MQKPNDRQCPALTIVRSPPSLAVMALAVPVGEDDQAGANLRAVLERDRLETGRGLDVVDLADDRVDLRRHRIAKLVDHVVVADAVLLDQLHPVAPRPVNDADLADALGDRFDKFEEVACRAAARLGPARSSPP